MIASLNMTLLHNLPSVGHCRFLQVDIADWENTLWTEEGSEMLLSVTILHSSPAMSKRRFSIVLSLCNWVE